MSKSEKLRESLKENVKNEKSKHQDKTIQRASYLVLEEMRKLFPNRKFGLQKRLSLRKIESLIRNENFETSDKSYITPDGWFLWVELNGEKYYILVSEQKSQGTNDKRLLEGKSKQSSGNAVERLGKNIAAAEVLFGNEEVTPIIVFLQGCDFYDSETLIADRVRTIARFSEMNKTHVFKKQVLKYVYLQGSYYMRGHSMSDQPGTSDWTLDEMMIPMLEIAKETLNYYIEKYGE